MRIGLFKKCWKLSKLINFQNEITKSESRLSPQQLFLRKKAHICKYLAKNLLDVKFSDVNLDENGISVREDALKKVKEDVEKAFTVLSQLFSYSRSDECLRDASDDLVPNVLTAEGTISEKAILAVLEKVIEMRHLSGSALISECFPSLLIYLIASKCDSSDLTR
ncbi:unnamed protein product, partial [Anisakis simplex]|uniref:Uncharacterized protein n=1 Tax=Anisakis simplex TaxID=6269 RepID=A0A0M3J9V6_ANISI